MASGSSKLAVYGAIAGNVAIAVSKFVAAALTGSSAMLSEGIHSTVDTVKRIFIEAKAPRAAGEKPACAAPARGAQHMPG